MESWFNFYTLAAFVLGVFFSATIKGLVSGLKSKTVG